MASDAAIVIASTVLAYYARFSWLAPVVPPSDRPRVSTHAIPFLLAAPVMMGTMISMGLYRARRDQRFFTEAVTIIKAVAVGVMILVALLTLLRDWLYEGRNLSGFQFVVFAEVCAMLLLIWRFSFRYVLRVLRRRGWNLRHVAIVGTGRLGQVVYHTLKRNSWTGITPNFFISHHDTTTRATCLNVPVRGGLKDLEKVLDEAGLSGIIIALPARLAAELPNLLQRLERYPLDVRIVPDMNPKHMPMNMATSELDGMPILSVRESPLNGWGRITKRTLDLVGSIAGLIVFAIPMLIIAILIRLSGPGAVIFRQERMSLNGQRFRIYKFRTMEPADAEQQALLEAGKGTDAWTDPTDGRVTRIGKILRRTSMDELPQLLNVLIGEMSLVGPRPERPELIQRFREDWRGYMLRQNVKAGMTGWAQINGLRGRTSLRKRLQYDLFYIRNWSLGFDIRILWMTIFRGFVHPNAY